MWFVKPITPNNEVATTDRGSPRSYLATCPPQERRILGSIPAIPHILQSAHDLSSKKLVAATDGSFDPHTKRASGCWILASRDGKSIYCGVCPVDGSPDAMDSYRAELEAIRSLTYYIRFLRRTIPSFIADVHLVVWIDNMEALKKGTGDFSALTPKETMVPKFDIIEDIRSICETERIRLRGSHVKSHQEVDGPEVPLEVRLNEACDEAAKRYVRTAGRYESSRPTATRTPTATATLVLGSRVVTNRYRSRLLYAATAPALTAYILERTGMTPLEFEWVDWEQYGLAMSKVFKGSKQRFSRLVKYAHDLQNTGHQKRLFSAQQKSQPEASDRCPCCNERDETTMHLHQCKDPETRRVLQTGLNELEDALRQRHVPSQMWTAMRMGVQSFCNGADLTACTPADDVREAFEVQSRIGWDQFLKGRLARHWVTKCKECMSLT